MTTMRTCPAGLGVYVDHDHGDVDRHALDMSFCNHTPRPKELPTEVLVGIDPPAVIVLDQTLRDAQDWLSRGSGTRRLFRATLTYQTELTRIPPVPAKTEEQPVTWS